MPDYAIRQQVVIHTNRGQNNGWIGNEGMMPQTSRDRSLVEHLATKVMGFRDHRIAPMLWYSPVEHHTYPKTWNPLEPSAATWEVWERAREMGIHLELHARPDDARWIGDEWWCSWQLCTSITADSGPRAICEAIGKATGWVATQ